MKALVTTDKDDRLSSSSSSDEGATKNNLPEVLHHAVTSKDPILPLNGTQMQPLVFKDNQKVAKFYMQMLLRNRLIIPFYIFDSLTQKLQ